MATYEREVWGSKPGMGTSVTRWVGVDVASSTGAAAELNIIANAIYMPACFSVCLVHENLNGDANALDLQVKMWWTDDQGAELFSTVMGTPTVQAEGAAGRDGTAAHEFAWNLISPHIVVESDQTPRSSDIYIILSPGSVYPGHF